MMVFHCSFELVFIERKQNLLKYMNITDQVSISTITNYTNDTKFKMFIHYHKFDKSMLVSYRNFCYRLGFEVLTEPRQSESQSRCR